MPLHPAVGRHFDAGFQGGELQGAGGHAHPAQDARQAVLRFHLQAQILVPGQRLGSRGLALQPVGDGVIAKLGLVLDQGREDAAAGDLAIG